MTVFSKVFQSINQFINSDILVDESHSSIKNKYSFKHQFDEDDDDDYDYDDYNNNKNNSNNASFLNDEPDNNEINKWIPSNRPKAFKVIILFI